jgi:hypothetical protein
VCRVVWPPRDGENAMGVEGSLSWSGTITWLTLTVARLVESDTAYVARVKLGKIYVGLDVSDMVGLRCVRVK